MDVISFQKIFGLYGLKGHIVDIWRDVTLEDGRTHTRTECEDSARILETEFAKFKYIQIFSDPPNARQTNPT